jgi:hypothetical protein
MLKRSGDSHFFWKEQDMGRRGKKKKQQPVPCNTASGDLHWMIKQQYDRQIERPIWNPFFSKFSLVLVVFFLALLFAYGFIRLILELVFPIPTPH